jgi:hypothetical protein
LGLSGHTLFTGLFGASLRLALQTRRRWLAMRTAEEASVDAHDPLHVLVVVVIFRLETLVQIS